MTARALGNQLDAWRDSEFPPEGFVVVCDTSFCNIGRDFGSGKASVSTLLAAGKPLMQTITAGADGEPIAQDSQA